MRKMDSTHYALIRACVAKPDEFESALRRWESIQDINDIDYATMRLIPFLYKKALLNEITMKSHGICKGLYLRSWYLFKTSGNPTENWINKNLYQEDIIFLKGCALQKTVYSIDPPIRPADDIDILIRSSAIKSTIIKMQSESFTFNKTHSLSTQTNLRKAINFQSGLMNIDVHWNIFHVSLDPEFTERLWQRSVILNNGSRTLTDTDNLIHTLLHGYENNSIAPIRWVIDAFSLVSANTVDWDLFWEEVYLSGWNRIIHNQLNLLKEFGILIEIPKNPKKKFSFVMLVTELFLASESLLIKRLCRLLGFDFGVWAQNQKMKPTMLNYILHFSNWFPLVVNSWREFKQASKFI